MHRTLRSSLTLIALLATHTSCSQSGDEAGLTMPQPSLATELSVQVLAGALPRGSEGILRAQNTSAEAALYGPCQVFFERWTGYRWVAATPSDRICLEVLYRVAANSTLDRAFAMPAGVASGTYRLAVDFWRDKAPERVRVYSNEFDIQ